jgi:hypothetical protein
MDLAAIPRPVAASPSYSDEVRASLGSAWARPAPPAAWTLALAVALALAPLVETVAAADAALAAGSPVLGPPSSGSAQAVAGLAEAYGELEEDLKRVLPFG